MDLPEVVFNDYDRACRNTCTHCAHGAAKEGNFHVYVKPGTGLQLSPWWGECIKEFRLCLAPDLKQWANTKAYRITQLEASEKANLKVYDDLKSAIRQAQRERDEQGELKAKATKEASETFQALQCEKREVEHLREQIQMLQVEKRAPSFHVLVQQLGDAAKQLGKMNDIAEYLIKENDRVRGQRQVLQSERNDLKVKYDSASYQVSRLKEEVLSLRSTRDNLRKELIAGGKRHDAAATKTKILSNALQAICTLLGKRHIVVNRYVGKTLCDVCDALTTANRALEVTSRNYGSEYKA